MLAYLRKCKCNTQTMLNREYSKGILCHAALCTQETKHKARCIAGQCADERLLRTRRVMWTRDATMLLYDTVDFLKKGVAARCAEWNICRRGNCCRRLKIDAACCASIRINAPSLPLLQLVGSLVMLRGRTTAIILMTKSSRHTGTLRVLQWRAIEARQFKSVY